MCRHNWTNLRKPHTVQAEPRNLCLYLRHSVNISNLRVLIHWIELLQNLHLHHLTLRMLLRSNNEMASICMHTSTCNGYMCYSTVNCNSIKLSWLMECST